MGKKDKSELVETGDAALAEAGVKKKKKDKTLEKVAEAVGDEAKPKLTKEEKAAKKAKKQAKETTAGAVRESPRLPAAKAAEEAVPAAGLEPVPGTASSDAVGDLDLTCKDCDGSFVFTATERANATARGYGPMVRCPDCRAAKRQKYETAEAESSSIPVYDAATEAKLDAWVAAKRSKAFDAADRLRAALSADGINADEARPLGFVKSAVQEKSAWAKRTNAKCFNCGSKGHRSEDCMKRPAGSTKCYYCGQAGHLGKNCKQAPAPKPIDPSTQRCFHCGLVGHLAAACGVKQTKSRTACHICGEEGHVSRYCPRQGERALKPGTVQSEVDGKLGRWAAAREQKDYETADRIRAELMAVGVNPNKPAGKGQAKPK